MIRGCDGLALRGPAPHCSHDVPRSLGKIRGR